MECKVCVELNWLRMGGGGGAGGGFLKPLMNIRVQKNAEDILISWGTISFFKRTVFNGLLKGHTYVTFVDSYEIF
jgi:hypothetical protein